ncbi:MAG: hypothetical protein COB08_013680 [Rhodobacteraceae bacterium]|nr:hypothetical protein [Paracoccaceae bacterium]
MFKNDRMMMILTGLVLAVFAGSMVKYGDRVIAMMSGEEIVVTQDDSYSVRAGASQILDVLSNDTIKGPIVVLTRPSCGSIAMSSNNRLSFSSDDACNGVVEFAYCVDNEGKCAPNAVKINVISVSFAQANTAAANAPDQVETAEVVLTEAEKSELEIASIGPASPASDPNAPKIESFSVEMAPPALAAPSVTELVSPGVAVAAIRRATGSLNSASSTDQNIATQNSASIRQTASAGPITFAAPVIANSSNISLGGSELVVTSVIAAPSGLEATSVGGSNIVQLERGPEALDSLQIAQAAPSSPTSPPLAAAPEGNGGAPVFVASAQTDSPTPDASFSAQPADGGPIALIALNRTPTRGNAAGESLNIILSEPGLQSFRSPADTPAALAPASARPTTVSILERGPNVEAQLSPPTALSYSSELAVGVSEVNDRSITRNTLDLPIAAASITSYNAVGVIVVASQPNQTIVPDTIIRTDTISRFISVSQASNQPNSVAAATALSVPGQLDISLPSLDLQPAGEPQVREASLNVAPEVEVVTAPAQNSACEIILLANTKRGANISLEIMAACKPNQMVTIEHSGLSFSVLTDALGATSVLIPAMEANAEINVKFEDQSTNSTTIFVRDVDSIVRAGVSWQANMNLDLSAIEFGAALGSDGHITADTPRDYRTSRVKGGGYLLQLGDPSLGRGALAEVYTMPTTRNQQRGTIAMSIVISNVAPVCGQTITAKTVRSRENRSAGIRNVRFSVPACGTIVSGPIALPGAIDDIRLAGR